MYESYNGHCEHYAVYKVDMQYNHSNDSMYAALYCFQCRFASAISLNICKKLLQEHDEQ